MPPNQPGEKDDPGELSVSPHCFPLLGTLVVPAPPPRPPSSGPPSTHFLLQNLPGLEPFVGLWKCSQVPVVLISLHGAVPTGHPLPRPSDSP